ncbi:hypothetical protein ACW6AV_002267 [Edwardsiella piscicida]|uniref:hypothetical protein n=1 Tax=Edwardsiella piscicida TaxID=1263550 RepID=UPI0009BAEAC5|nr:hypothetical protein [Edwardsiella piscicida]ARD16858.1 hypothetical protein BXA22_00060 [Edwardsiella piscicida]ARD20008.1 hypothetical protein BXA22_17375 [Edwardsiella piscicida]ELM3734842.1 hypothetical protein [Edwardsiella piscicida]QBB14152.1 hypothetical protein EVK84_17205 [Edwardsiella piscicida]WGS78558.1 hypothetical protein PED68_07925 [Edwardsiella piscicida]
MSEQVAVVYIGPKVEKRDTVTGSRLVFPRHIAVSVDAAVAYQLLAFPSVFIPAEKLEAFLVESQEKREEKQQALQAAQAQVRLQAEQQSFALEIEGTIVDISKFTVAQLITLAEAQELGVQKGAQEKADEFRARVRDAYREKTAVPG